MFSPSYLLIFLQECVIFAQTKKNFVSGMSPASNVERLVRNFIYLTKPSPTKASNTTSLRAKTQSKVLTIGFFHMIHSKTKSIRFSMSCSVFGDSAEE